MPSIVSFHRNVGHAVILIILFSFFYLATPVCRFIHLLSETTLKMRGLPTLQHGCSCGVFYHRAGAKAIIICILVCFSMTTLF